MTTYEGTYIHIPFCVRKCLYCDFPSYAGCSADMREQYVQALLREIAGRAAQGVRTTPTATIYIGGGTPSVLTTAQLSRIVTALRQAGFWSAPAEATIEVNPGTADAKKLFALRELGFDRVSFGVQSLCDAELRAIGRIHMAAQALTAVRDAQAAGFTRINCDAITGLPGQTPESLQNTLETLLALGLTHLSVYSLIVEAGTPLAAGVAAGRITLPDEDTELALYELVPPLLQSYGLHRYEISNYAADGEQSRHNLLYWRYRPTLGLGAAAAGFDGNTRRTNTPDVAAYIQDPLHHYDEEQLAPHDQLAEYLFMGLRTTAGVNLKDVQERFGVDVWQHFGAALAPFRGRGCLRVSSDRLSLTPLGMRYGNQIFAVFV